MAGANQPIRTTSTWTETGAIEQADQLDDWIAIDRDGTIWVNSGKVELGTGVRTALAQIAAEELDVPIRAIRMEMGRTGVTPDEGYTAGSKTVALGGFSIRRASAAARLALLELASERFGVEVSALSTRDGIVVVANDPSRSVSYGELAGGKKLGRRISGQTPTKSPSDYRIVGSDVPRIELPGKFTGAGSYVHDLRLPRMVHARVVRPPSAGAECVSVDERTKGDAVLVRIGNFIAVVAEREETAIEEAGKLVVEWRETLGLPELEELHAELRKAPVTDEEIVTTGDFAGASKQAKQRLKATYYQPHQAHASIGPSCAVAELRDGVMTVWCSTQGVYPLRGAIADLLDMPAEKVRIIHMEGAGCYGHNGADDAAADAAVLARETGKTVRVQWSREDEFAWEPYGPAMVMELEGTVDSEGSLTGWRGDVWTPSHTMRARTGIELIAGQLIEGRQPPPKKLFRGGDRNAPTNYDIASQRIVIHWIERPHVRSSSYRSLGAFANCFANESFVDELAAAAEVDPVQLRLNHLSDPRARDVVAAAARAGSWGSPLPDGEGRGIAFARYENEEAYVATVAHVKVERETGVIRVVRIVVAHDCGLIINPDGVRNQIEGNVIQSLSRALFERATWKGSHITSLDWQSYRIIKFSEIPDLEIILINRPNERSVGAGEPATITTAPAVANAVYAATGARLRRVPFTPDEVLSALEP